MRFEIELYKSRGEKYICIVPDTGSSGAIYHYEDAEDIAENIAGYMNHYFPEIVEDPGDND